MWWMPGWKGKWNSKAENAAQKIRHHNVKALSVWTSEWEIFSPKSLQEWDIFTCGNDGKAGTREDVGIVALAWLVRLQPINQWSTKVENPNNCYLSKPVEVREGGAWRKQCPTISVGVRLHNLTCLQMSAKRHFHIMNVMKLKSRPPPLYIRPCWSGLKEQRWSAPRWTWKTSQYHNAFFVTVFY